MVGIEQDCQGAARERNAELLHSVADCQWMSLESALRKDTGTCRQFVNGSTARGVLNLLHCQRDFVQSLIPPPRIFQNRMARQVEPLLKKCLQIDTRGFRKRQPKIARDTGSN